MTASRYSSVATVLHWLIAILIVGQLAGGLYMHKLPDTSLIKFDLYQLHKSFGLSILTLTIVRLGWRLTHKAPPLPLAMPGWQKFAARAVHVAFYVLLILTPLAGWAMVSVSPTDIPTIWFGLFKVPHLWFVEGVTDRAATEEVLKDRHEFLAFTIIFLLALHVGAALKHAFINRDGVLRSMAPANAGSWIGIAALLGVLGLGAVYYVSNPTPRGGGRSAPGAPAVEGAWIVDYGASELGFVATQTGTKFEGRFGNFDAAIIFDPDDLANASIDVSIDMTSATTGDRQRDSALPGGDWFAARDFPAARFQSTNVEATGANAYVAHGALTIRDAKRDLDLPFTLNIEGDTAQAEGEATLIRTDYGVGQGEFETEEWVGLEVTVTVAITATR